MTAGFVGNSKLRVELNDDNGKWGHLLPLVFRSEKLGKVFYAKMGSETDFCSVPRLPIIYARYGNRAHKAGAMHDAALEQGISREDAATLFLEVMEVEGIPLDIRQALYAGVKLHDASQPTPTFPISGE